MNTQEKEILYAGIDIGSTTTKTVVVDARNGQIVHSGYRRHSAQQAARVVISVAADRTASSFFIRQLLFV